MKIKKEIVAVDEKFAARFKKWYHFNWRYIGISANWKESYIKKPYILCDSIEEAEEKMNSVFPKKINVVKTLYYEAN